MVTPGDHAKPFRPCNYGACFVNELDIAIDI
jgi:hypothetical protein